MLGALLIQPQMLARLGGRNRLEDLIDEAFAIGHRLVLAPGIAHELVPALEHAIDALVTRLRTRIEPGLPAFDALVQRLAGAFVDGLNEVFGGAKPADAAEVLDLFVSALQKLEAAPAALQDTRIRGALRAVGEVLARDLGFSQDLLRTETDLALRDLAQALRGLQDVSLEARACAQALACLLDRLRALVLPALPRLDLGTDRLIDILLARLQALGFDNLRAKAGCLIGKARGVLQACATLLRGLQAGATVGTPRAAPRATPRRHAMARAAGQVAAAGVPPRSEDGHYCWYGSWLFGQRLQSMWLQFVPRYPGDEVWHSVDGRKLVLRTVHGSDIVLASADATRPWHELAPFGADTAPLRARDTQGTRFSFGEHPPEFLEIFTRVAATATETGKVIWHLVRMAQSPQEFGQIALAVWNLVKALSAGIGGVPLASLIVRGTRDNVGPSWCITPMLTWLTVFGFAFEGIHTKTANAGGWIGYFGTLLGADALNAWIPDRLLRGAHDLLISLYTLVNQTGPVAPGGAVPGNFLHGLPLVDLVEFLCMLLYVLVIPRHFYAHPGYETNPELFAFWFVGAPAVGAVGGMLGAMLVWAFARHVDWADFGRQAGMGAFRGLHSFLLYLYLFREGDTDRGRYTTAFKADHTDYSPPHDPFDGYPPKAGSPYKLPYSSELHYFVGQAHMGVFSHMPLHRYNRPQIYAIDFAHDFGDLVLAVRDGTVVDWYDFLPDDTEPDEVLQDRTQEESIIFMAGLGVGGTNWRTLAENSPKRNYVLVRHDTLLPEHDKTFGGAPASTYTMYMHGTTEGVRRVFKSTYNIDPPGIIGTRVQQGNPIMEAGDTGMSTHNHLHLQVQPGPATSGPARVKEEDLEDVTLPFVFADIDERDGVPRNLVWYRSGNQLREELPP